MTAVFADTFYWIAFTNLHDLAHEYVKAFTLSSRPVTICTTEEVLTEYFELLRRVGSALSKQGLHQRSEDAPKRNCLRCSPNNDVFQRGLSLYRARLDKGYSLTDCISMQIMRNEGIADVLTNDVHFEQEGFRALLRGR